MTSAVLGVDIGTSSSKGVVVDLDGRILATATREHEVSRPRPGWVEMDASVWWDEFASLSRELVGALAGVSINAVGVSGMGPCVAVADDRGELLRPAILYGVDTRSQPQIAALNERFGRQAIVERCGSELSTQAVGPKLAWLADNEPAVATTARYLFMPSSWLGFKLTGSYVLDHHSASQSVPLYDTGAHSWFEPWWHDIAPNIVQPELVWPGEIIGMVTPAAASTTGLPAGIPVIAGTIDAWTEAVSVNAQSPGDLMLMYGTTMFLICTTAQRATAPGLWGTVGAFPGVRNLAGGMATSGAITSWLRRLFGAPGFSDLLDEAAQSGVGARGLLMLPYFAGERTPVADPDARGVIAGLTVEHSRGDLYRAALEATAMGVRHNVDAFRAAGAPIERIVAVGGGTQGVLWTQIVSDVTGLTQEVPSVTIGACFGAAYLAARVLVAVDIGDWNPTASTVTPDPSTADAYNGLFELYRGLYPATVEISHRLAERQRGMPRVT